MCGRFVAASPLPLLVDHFDVDEVRVDPDDDAAAPSWNVAPTERVLAVAEHDGRRLLGAFRWGLVPAWAPDPSNGARLINARAETLADKPAFREAFARRRCLVPADGFYEWRLAPGGAKQPVYLAPSPPAVLAFAGLWEVWRDPAAPAAPPMRTCTIVTTDANERVTPLHSRMPVVLPRAAWSTWLDPGEHDPGLLASLLVPAPEDLLDLRDASRLVNDVRNKGAEVLDPATAAAAGPAEPSRPPEPAAAPSPTLPF